MSKLQHTPGPWKCYNTDPVETELDIVIESQFLTMGWLYSSNENSEANARLIAAAPEMLIELLKSIAELDKTGFTSITAETIIMKATGWSYDILNDVLTKLSTGMSIEEILK